MLADLYLPSSSEDEALGSASPYWLRLNHVAFMWVVLYLPLLSFLLQMTTTSKQTTKLLCDSGFVQSSQWFFFSVLNKTKTPGLAKKEISSFWEGVTFATVPSLPLAVSNPKVPLECPLGRSVDSTTCHRRPACDCIVPMRLSMNKDAYYLCQPKF